MEYLQEILRLAPGPVAQHLRWIQQSHIADSDRATFEDSILAHAIEIAATYDNLNVANLACFELLVRRRQVLVEAHRACPSSPDYTGAEHFLGLNEHAGGGIVIASLAQHVAERLKTAAAIRKERRLFTVEMKEGKGKGRGEDGHEKDGNNKKGKGSGKGAAKQE